ncbi:ASCH domain, predicted RNA-binding domain (plasmid) [Halalkaliarchaeum sp. AArc-CO]|uniref:ASCH domain-containing protein n=1 Tax=Halalkaliarchaeum sp. AArc-CO TaxID=2866381 RepID=UPI00217E63F1|nr:ASCH domain-containing protein [Halalkaliarchaeum sp. AArc-CO]UWG49281.1 ASCH domain, predicted RNA-binding domain [Halalkaliarchaeum sp. AArc-CO]
MDALLSIKPEFVEKIFSGEKRYEFRRTSFRDSDAIDTVFLYASSPTQEIVGAFTIDDVIEDTPDNLWMQYQEESGFQRRQRFMDYFTGVETGYAYKIDEVHQLQNSVNPWEFDDEFVPPTSFYYVNGEIPSRAREAISESLRSAYTPRVEEYGSD